MTTDQMIDELCPYKLPGILGPDPYGVILTSYQANQIRGKLRSLEAQLKLADGLAKQAEDLIHLSDFNDYIQFMLEDYVNAYRAAEREGTK